MHPVEVYAPHASTRPVAARVFVTTERVQVWRETAGAPELLIDQPITEPVEADRGTLFGQLRLETESGPVHVTKGHGCGCHSMLKALSPPVSW